MESSSWNTWTKSRTWIINRLSNWKGMTLTPLFFLLPFLSCSFQDHPRAFIQQQRGLSVLHLSDQRKMVAATFACFLGNWLFLKDSISLGSTRRRNPNQKKSLQPTEDDWELILKGARELKFSDGDVVIKEGAWTRAIYQLVAGNTPPPPFYPSHPVAPPSCKKTEIPEPPRVPLPQDGAMTITLISCVFCSIMVLKVNFKFMLEV